MSRQQSWWLNRLQDDFYEEKANARHAEKRGNSESICIWKVAHDCHFRCYKASFHVFLKSQKLTIVDAAALKGTPFFLVCVFIYTSSLRGRRPSCLPYKLVICTNQKAPRMINSTEMTMIYFHTSLCAVEA